MLGGMIETATWKGEFAAHRAEVDDFAPLLAAHAWQDELGQSSQPEDIRLELAAYLFHRYFFNWPLLAIAGIVDEHADGAFALFDRCAGSTHRGLVADIE